MTEKLFSYFTFQVAINDIMAFKEVILFMIISATDLGNLKFLID